MVERRQGQEASLPGDAADGICGHLLNSDHVPDTVPRAFPVGPSDLWQRVRSHKAVPRQVGRWGSLD